MKNDEQTILHYIRPHVVSVLDVKKLRYVSTVGHYTTYAWCRRHHANLLTRSCQMLPNKFAWCSRYQAYFVLLHHDLKCNKLAVSLWKACRCYVTHCTVMSVCLCVSRQVADRSKHATLLDSSCWCGHVLGHVSSVTWRCRVHQASVSCHQTDTLAEQISRQRDRH